MTLERASVFIENCLPELENYILSETLYWQVSANMVPLTIGNLLFENRVVYAYDRTASRVFKDRFAVMQAKWSVHWQMKAEREFENRLRLWTDFLEQSRNDGDMPITYYRTNARHRAILAMLATEISKDEFTHQLSVADSLLRGMRRKKEFIWAPELQHAFPQNEFWFLY